MDEPYANAWPILLDAPMLRRVWGGSRFVAAGGPIGEVWLVHSGNIIVQGPCAGSTLSTAVETMGSALLGRRLAELGVRGFPLLIKLIDAVEWLSVQVHPNDAQAELLEGPGHCGKTEAWFVLDSEPGAEVIAGTRPGVTPAQVRHAIRAGGILDLVQRFQLGAGDALMLPAGAVHALGPGLFIYEIQQSSDITYRVYDWERPASEGRALHIDQSHQSVDASLRIDPVHIVDPAASELVTIAASNYFHLELGRVGPKRLELELGGENFHVVTVIEGDVVLRGVDWDQRLRAFGTALIPAAIARYSIEGSGRARFLLARPG